MKFLSGWRSRGWALAGSVLEMAAACFSNHQRPHLHSTEFHCQLRTDCRTSPPTPPILLKTPSSQARRNLCHPLTPRPRPNLTVRFCSPNLRIRALLSLSPPAPTALDPVDVAVSYPCIRLMDRDTIWTRRSKYASS